MPAYNASKTIKKTHEEIIEQGVVDLIIVVDDYSIDNTTLIAKNLIKTKVISHKKNLGYGANQKTCYKAALDEGADIIIMVKPL